MFLFPFKATKQIPKCLNRSLQTLGPAYGRPGEAFQLGAHKKRTWGENAGARGGGGGESGGTRPCSRPRRYRSPVSPLPSAASAQGPSVPQIPSGVSRRAGEGGSRRWRRGRAALRVPRSCGGAGRGDHGEGVFFRGGQKHQHRWIDKKMEYCI